MPSTKPKPKPNKKVKENPTITGDRWAEAKSLKVPAKIASLYAECEITLSELLKATG